VHVGKFQSNNKYQENHRESGAVLLSDSSDSEHQSGRFWGSGWLVAGSCCTPIAFDLHDMSWILFPALKEWLALVCEFLLHLSCAWFYCLV
jgi:hypothetical protein